MHIELYFIVHHMMTHVVYKRRQYDAYWIVFYCAPYDDTCSVIYSHNKYAYVHIYMFMQYHNDTINN